MILFDDSFLLLGKNFQVSETITINNPKIKDIFDFGEQKYYSIVSAFVSKPSDYKVQMVDMGIDYELIPELDFLHMMAKNIPLEDSRILFNELDFSKMEIYINTETQEKLIGYDDVFIDDLTYRVVSDFIRKINGISIKKPEVYANEEVKRYRIEVERNNLKYTKKEPFKSMLIPIVSVLVNSAESSYNYNSVMDLTISQVHDAIDRIKKIKNYNDVMQGLYSGTISSKDINQNEINWLT